jgi:SagB-type dehydrogenase family enzyme
MPTCAARAWPWRGMTSKIGDDFQRETKYVRGEVAGPGLDWANKPETYKEYSDAATITLESPRLKGGKSLWETLRGRRSVRTYGRDPITHSELSRLLWAAQGITRRSGGAAFRTAPSAGALYPIETYLVVHRAAGLEPGIYHYAVLKHALEQLRVGDFRGPAARAALDQRIAFDADVVFAWSAMFERSKWKYGQRAYRYVYLDAGHIAQNVALAAVAMGLGSCQIAALYDDEANALFGVDGEKESVIYMTAVGRDRR